MDYRLSTGFCFILLCRLRIRVLHSSSHIISTFQHFRDRWNFRSDTSISAFLHDCEDVRREGVQSFNLMSRSKDSLEQYRKWTGYRIGEEDIWGTTVHWILLFPKTVLDNEHDTDICAIAQSSCALQQ